MSTYTMTEALRERLTAEMHRDPTVLLLGEDIAAYGGAFGVTRGLLDIFGSERVRDTPISENAMVGMAVGAAAAGSRPVVEIMFMDFITLAIDPLVNMAAKLRYIFDMACPMVLRTPAGGGRGYGATHSQCLERMLFGIPGLRIAVPSDPTDASALLATALRGDEPTLFIEHKMLYGYRVRRPENLPEPLPFGRGRICVAGDDITIVAWSWMTRMACAAAEQLAASGTRAEVIDLRTLSPLDIEIVCESVERTSRLLIVEEGPGTGGIGAEIAQQALERVYDCLDAPIRRVTSPDCPVPASSALEAAMLPDAARIAAAALELVAE